jgi:tricorn protease
MTWKSFFSALSLTLLLSSWLAKPVEAQTRLLRFPDIHGNQVVFTYAGDLWLASTDGGTARRLTAHPGLEIFGKFSPDGQSIAFTGQYDGDEQVYVVPITGGAPKQLTFYPAEGPLPPRWGYDNQVYGWTPDGSSILFRSLRHAWDLTNAHLFTVSIDGGLPEQLPMPESGAGDFSPDGTRIVYSPLFRDFRHWKRYQGGWAQDLFIFDLESHDIERVTDHVRSDRDPMWLGDKIYFSSDRDEVLNLYSWDIATKQTEQLTSSSVWDIRWPSADATTGQIVYERSGALEIFDIAEKTSKAIEISVPTDGIAMRPSRIDASDEIEDFGLAPKGKRAVFAARGDIFTVPVEHGPTRNITRTSGAHDREPAWSPDGKTVAFISDADGEEELWLVAQHGRDVARQLTDGQGGRLSSLSWSPDGTYLTYRDQSARLLVANATSGEITEIADDASKFGLDWDWSPNGGFLAYSLAEATGFRSLHIWNASTGESRKVTTEFFNDFSPAFDPAGDYLYFLSDREYAPQIGSIEFNYVVDRETYAYALALRKDVAHPFPPRSDEVEEEEEEEVDDNGSDKADKKKAKKKEKDEEADEESKDEPKKPISIDFDGLGERIARVPVDADNHFGIVALDDSLMIIKGGAGYYGRRSDRQTEIVIYSIEDRESESLVSDIRGAALSPDGSKILVGQGGSYSLYDAKKGGGGSAKSVSTSGLQVDRVPQQEWAQIFDEVWRRFRDFFYVENMHGWDWNALRDRYRPLLAHVGHRSDLNYLISEMIAELNVSHSYITGGDWFQPERPNAAMLGARFALDEEAGRFRISRILRGDNGEDQYRSPLTAIGVDVSEGDYVLAINGVDLDAADNPFQLLRHAGGSPVELSVSDKPSDGTVRQVTVDPIRDEGQLLYLGWVKSRHDYVTEKTGGRVGYIHLPDMGGSGIREWIKWFYPQIRKEGLVIDVRNNGGGNVSSMIVERLQRELLMLDFERNNDLDDPYPGAVFHGHLVCILDEDTASDGDQFAYVFRQAGLGKLVGKRSWGGVVGIYGGGQLIDGGGLSVPEAGSTGPDGSWAMEGHGVEPDFEVDNEPKELLSGRDQQLDKAIEVVMAQIEAEPKSFPGRPEAPIKTPDKKPATATP